MTRWLEFDNAEDVAAAAAESIALSASDAILQRGRFRIVLAGGTTPLACYQRLAENDLDWSRWEVFYGDERCLPAQDSERNHQMVAATGLTRHIEKHYIIPAEKGPVEGAESYQTLIKDACPFDMVLLGMGEDGHTASLFPGLKWQVNDTETLVIPVEGAPKPPAERISLSLPALQNCRQMMVMVTGSGKRQAVQQWLQGVRLPIAEVAAIEQASVYIQRGLMGR